VRAAFLIDSLDFALAEERFFGALRAFFTTPFLLKTRRTVPLVPRKLRPNRGIANPV
jgi:hypothetical protein